MKDYLILKGGQMAVGDGVPEVIPVLPLGHVVSSKGEFDVDEESFQAMKARTAQRAEVGGRPDHGCGPMDAQGGAVPGEQGIPLPLPCGHSPKVGWESDGAALPGADQYTGDRAYDADRQF